MLAIEKKAAMLEVSKLVGCSGRVVPVTRKQATLVECTGALVARCYEIATRKGVSNPRKYFLLNFVDDTVNKLYETDPVIMQFIFSINDYDIYYKFPNDV